MLAICRAHPNWIPKNPKFMFQIVRNCIAGGPAAGWLTVDCCCAGCNSHLSHAVVRGHRRRASEPVFQHHAIADLRARQRHPQFRILRRIIENHQHRCFRGARSRYRQSASAARRAEMVSRFRRFANIGGLSAIDSSAGTASPPECATARRHHCVRHGSRRRLRQSER